MGRHNGGLPMTERSAYYAPYRAWQTWAMDGGSRNGLNERRESLNVSERKSRLVKIVVAMSLPSTQ